jgi:phage-related protein
MAAVRVLLYREGKNIPVLDYLASAQPGARQNLIRAIRRLAEAGDELRRPHSDYLEDGVYELRTHDGRAQHRILYFFDGQAIVILSHGLRKEAAVPAGELRRAKLYRTRYVADPGGHSADVEEY